MNTYYSDRSSRPTWLFSFGLLDGPQGSRYQETAGSPSRRHAQTWRQERVDFMAVTARQTPDFRTISDFRKRHLPALGGLFTQVLQLCQKAGLVTLGHVALDGTKIRANASKHKAMSYGRMKQAEPELVAEVARWLAEAAASDAREDQAYGDDRRGDELPEWVAHKQHRVEKIRAAKAALEAEAQEAARAQPRLDDAQSRPPGDTAAWDAPRQGAAQFHRSGQSDHEDA